MAEFNHNDPPDFASEAFRGVREAMMAAQAVDEERAIILLLEAWNDDRDQRLEELAARQREQGLQQQQQEERRRNENRRGEQDPPEGDPDEDPDAEQDEGGKKKPKMNNFTPGLAPPNVLQPRPSQYALQKIASFDFVEMYYFSKRGCQEAMRYSRSNADDTFGITSSNDILTLRPVASVKASKNATPDDQMPFAEYMQARTTFLEYIKAANWPATHVTALAMFFWNLECHPIRSTSNGELTLIAYAARIRRAWHDKLKLNNDDTFDISIINDALLGNIAAEINDDLRKRFEQKVSPPATTPCDNADAFSFPQPPTPSHTFTSKPT